MTVVLSGPSLESNARDLGRFLDSAKFVWDEAGTATIEISSTDDAVAAELRVDGDVVDSMTSPKF